MTDTKKQHKHSEICKRCSLYKSLKGDASSFGSWELVDGLGLISTLKKGKALWYCKEVCDFEFEHMMQDEK